MLAGRRDAAAGARPSRRCSESSVAEALLRGPAQSAGARPSGELPAGVAAAWGTCLPDHRRRRPSLLGDAVAEMDEDTGIGLTCGHADQEAGRNGENQRRNDKVEGSIVIYSFLSSREAVLPNSITKIAQLYQESCTIS